MLQLNKITVFKAQRTILEVDELLIKEGQFNVILGHNGSGKSTLMNLLARQSQPSKGNILLNQRSISQFKQRQLAQQIAFLPQKLPDAAGLSVTEIVQLGRYPWRGNLGRFTKHDHHLVRQAMQQCDVSQYHQHFVDHLSGGERQRAWLAMLLAQDTPMLLLDEPTSALDLAHQYALMTLLKQLNQQQKKSIVVILHDVNLACRVADRIIALKKGRICFDGSPEQLLHQDTLSMLYGIKINIVANPQNQQKVAIVS
ncbi:MAG: ABC transporter ATP-binding protein [Pseudoalteromonas prydzensis]|uniref:ABC transporter ATP-binding protein n=1 Tax=Pseudoalteromonas prydzensis TaxID=182141 RepID=UPI003F9CDC9E